MMKALVVAALVALSTLKAAGQVPESPNLMNDAQANAQEWERLKFVLPSEYKNFHPRNVTFLTTQIGWISAYGYDTSNTLFQHVLKSSDGGDSWRVIADNAQAAFALDTSHFWAACGDKLLTSSTGGVLWDALTLDMRVDQLYFADSIHGIALRSDNNTCRSTSDGGVSWQDGDTNVYLAGLSPSRNLGISFPHWRTGWLVSEASPFATDNGMIAHTTTAGRSWTYQKIYANYQMPMLYSVSFSDSSHGYAAGPGNLLRTSNGGKDWSKTSLPIRGYSIAGDYRDGLFVTGWNGQICFTSDGGASWRFFETGYDVNYSSISLDKTQGYVIIFGKSNSAENILLRRKLHTLTRYHAPETMHAHTIRDLEVAPNPVRSAFSVSFSSRAGLDVEISIYSILGLEVFRGYRRVQYDGFNQWHFGNLMHWKLANGVYFLQLKTAESLHTVGIWYDR
ncbi:MAG: hypothetical protein IPP94_08890 [Ignavibacteria bacterium]|nr:hypothetical protein [Ignavibacteria bacterium]